MNTMTVQSNGHNYQLRIRDVADASVAAEIFKHHEYRAADELIKQATLPIIDVGAHAGFFMLYARSQNPTVRIVCVEPIKDNVAALNQTIEDNEIKYVEIQKVAVGGKSGTGNMIMSKDTHNHRLANDKNALKKAETRLVQVLSLSDLLKNCIMEGVSLIKMDIEGAEYEVFRGIHETDFKKIKGFILEYHVTKEGRPEDVEKILRENGFGVQRFPSKFDKNMGFIFALNKRT